MVDTNATIIATCFCIHQLAEFQFGGTLVHKVFLGIMDAQRSYQDMCGGQQLVGFKGILWNMNPLCHIVGTSWKFGVKLILTEVGSVVDEEAARWSLQSLSTDSR